ncbi:phosphoethanolamine transferase [Roseateles chitinivorans]|uniref:phosphoethanolamine transferase n=1 Tax=Roseateles chitinivorans TaxID=2917965 RepID=UPI003D67A80B
MPEPSPASRRTRPVAAALLCGLLLLSFVLAHDGRRIAQVAVLALPALLWLRLRVSDPRWRRVRLVAVGAVLVLFLLDSAVRAFLQAGYRALPDSALVLSAVANTTPHEALEFAASQGASLAGQGVLLVAVIVGALRLLTVCNRHEAALRRPERWAMALLVLVCVASLAIKPWRRHHPLVYWPAWVASAHALQRDWSDQQQQRDALLSNARQAGVRFTGTGPSTVVLVLTDSVNRDNMSLYGYVRPTTPQLAALQQDERERMLTLRHAWSVEPGTVASLSGLFSFGTRDADDPVDRTHHVLALARAAGYRVWWMSNHDDTAIEQQHARLADSLEMINRESGRSGASLDGELLDCLEEALSDPAPRKLIVVHLLGAHPHYRLRAPADAPLMAIATDAVDAEMVDEGRPAWLRASRRAYDRAIAYHDTVVAASLRLTRRHAPRNGDAAWMFLSDHGQEVGHDISHAGHSPGTPAGYRIPALLWRQGAAFDARTAGRPFRADWAGWTLTDLMALEWQGARHDRNVLDARYVWQAPRLAAPVERFDQ